MRQRAGKRSLSFHNSPSTPLSRTAQENTVPQTAKLLQTEHNLTLEEPAKRNDRGHTTPQRDNAKKRAAVELA